MRPHVAVHRRRDDDRRGGREARSRSRCRRRGRWPSPRASGRSPARRRSRRRCRRRRCGRSGRRAAARGRRTRPAWRLSASNVSGADEPGRRRRQQDDDVGALGLEEAEQLDGLVGGDRAGDAERDQPAGEAAASRAHREQPELERLAAADLGVEDREALERQVRVDRVDALERPGPRRGRQAAGQDRLDVGAARCRPRRRARAGRGRAARRPAPGSRRSCRTASR